MAQAKILIGVMGVDQHENGAVAVMRFLKEAQMDVSYAGLFNTSETLLEKAMDEDVDVIGISCHSWEYIHYLPDLMQRLAAAERNVPVVVGGSRRIYQAGCGRRLSGGLRTRRHDQHHPRSRCGPGARTDRGRPNQLILAG